MKAILVSQKRNDKMKNELFTIGRLTIHRKKMLLILWRIVFSVVILTAILDRAGIFSGVLQLQTLYSFTSISGTYILAITLITLLSTILFNGNVSERVSKARAIGVMMMIITGLVYHFVLLPEKIAENPFYQVFTYGNIGAHYITPICMFADWLLFDEKGKISKWEPLICSVVPFAYFVIFSIYGYYGATISGKDTSYVYFFMDWGNLGAVGVIKWAVFLLICILCLTYLVYFIDHTLAKKKAFVDKI